ncbi:hypothetical protein ISS85_00600 [Candidatus Microgenomates bacterium]|nr:hypothetical protein [Candidatus Microgenomates bacterium]
MLYKKSSTLSVQTKQISNGILIKVEGKDFKIEYPEDVWHQTPSSVRETLLENLAFANTHFLPLILNKNKVKYKMKLPLFESFLFKNQLFDLLSCEKDDEVKPLTYLKKFYNLEFDFIRGESSFINTKEISNFETNQDIAILPFSFGKESLVTFGFCKEIGIKPVLFYCQEPAHPYEEKFKLKRLKEFKKEFNVETHFVKNCPGLFRYGIAFDKKSPTEVGWGAQTTILAMLAVPFVYKYQANYIFFGSEFSNNDYLMQNGWKSYISYDQTSFWTKQQSNIIRLLTNDQCAVKAMLKPLEQINIFFILNNRYPNLLKYLFPCFAQKPLYQDSQWCHECYKCEKLFIFALSGGLDPKEIGFKKNLLQNKDFLEEYLKEEKDLDMDFALYILYKKGFKGNFIEKFKKYKMNKIKSWSWYKNYFTKLKNYQNLPKKFRSKILAIYNEELENFKKILPQ